MTLDYNKLANNYIDAGRHREARDVLIRAFEKEYSDKHGHEQADIEFRVDHYIEQLLRKKRIESRLKEKDRDTDLYLYLADAIACQGDYDGAQRCIDRARYLAKDKNSSIFRGAVIFLTYRCNLKCSHCWNISYMKDEYLKEPELCADDIIRIIESSSLLRNVNLCFTGGEIFVRKDAEEILKAVSELGAGFTFITNGTFPDRLEKLLDHQSVKESIAGIHLSMDGCREAHDAIRGKGCFDKLIQSIKIIQSNNIECSVSTVIQDQNIHDIERVRQLSADLGIATHAFELEMCGTRYKRLENKDRIRPYLPPDHYLRILEEKRFPGKGCMAGITKCNIRPSGKVDACTTSSLLSPFVIGDLKEFEFDFDRLWASDSAEKTRDMIRTCSGCASFCER